MCCWDAPDPVNKKPWTLQIPSTLPLHIPSTTPKQGTAGTAGHKYNAAQYVKNV